MPYAVNQAARIWWTELGDGPPLILLMGFGHSHEIWHPLADALAEQFRILMMDNRGTGRSDAPRGRYTVELMASDAIAVMDAADVAVAHVFGLSLGSVIGQEIALTYAGRVGKLVLGCGAAPGGDTEIGSRIGLSLVLIKPLLPKRVGAWIMDRYLYDTGTPRERVTQAAQKMIRAQAPFKTALRQARGTIGYESAGRLDQISAPTLILHGRNDRLAPFANAERMHARIAGSRLVALSDAAHSFTADQPKRTLDEVLGFLQDDQRAGADHF